MQYSAAGKKSAAFPFFFCRDKTVFSGVPTELMRTKHFGANNSLRPPFFFLFHPYCGSLADNGNLYLLITDLLPVTTNGKCLLVIKHQVWMRTFTLTRVCVWCFFFVCFFLSKVNSVHHITTKHSIVDVSMN